jgi:hypothetical protein
MIKGKGERMNNQELRAEIEIKKYIENDLKEKGYKPELAAYSAIEGTTNILRVIKAELKRIRPIG